MCIATNSKQDYYCYLNALFLYNLNLTTTHASIYMQLLHAPTH